MLPPHAGLRSTRGRSRMMRTKAVAWPVESLPVPQGQRKVIVHTCQSGFLFGALWRTALTPDPCRIGEGNAEMSLKLRL